MCYERMKRKNIRISVFCDRTTITCNLKVDILSFSSLKCTAKALGLLVSSEMVGCFGFNGSLRQYFSQ